MLNTDDLRHYTGIGTGYSPEMMMHRAADEIDRLRVEVEVQAYWGPRWEQANAEILRLRAAIQQTLEENGHLADGGDVSVSEQLRRMAEDAKRYLFLRRQIYRNETGYLDLGGELACNWHDPNGGEIDRAIDAAMVVTPNAEFTGGEAVRVK